MVEINVAIFVNSLSGLQTKKLNRLEELSGIALMWKTALRDQFRICSEYIQCGNSCFSLEIIKNSILKHFLSKSVCRLCGYDTYKIVKMIWPSYNLNNAIPVPQSHRHIEIVVNSNWSLAHCKHCSTLDLTFNEKR